MSRQQMKRTVLAVVMLVAVMMMNVMVVEGALGNSPLTQMNQEEAYMEFGVDVIASQSFTGAHVDASGNLYVTFNDGIMRVPPAVVSSANTLSVGDFSVPNTPSNAEYDPCVNSPSPIPSPDHTCNFPATQTYVGVSNNLYLRVEAVRGNDISHPWRVGSRVYAIAQKPTPRILQWDAGSFSTPNSTYNVIENLNLHNPIKVMHDSTTGFTYIVTNNVASGNAVIIRINSADYETQSNWRYLSFLSSSIDDIDWDHDHSFFYMVGGSGSVRNGVWRHSNNFPISSTSVTPTIVATDAVSCNGTGVAIAFDRDISIGATRGDRVYVACSGQTNTAGSIEALSPTTFTRVNSTALTKQDDLFRSMVHDPITGILYIGTFGAGGESGFSQILQYSTVGDRREGRTETGHALRTQSMAMSPLTVPSGMRKGAPYFYAVGYNHITLHPAIARWAAVQGCVDNCGSDVTPQRGTCTRRNCACVNYADPESGETLTWLSPWCATLSCPFDCNGRGTCSNSTCVCDRTWTTTDVTKPCLEPRCPNDCFSSSQHGECVRNSTGYPEACSCTAGWTGDDCSLKTKLPCHLLTANCTGCVDNPACIWCASSRTCVPGSVNGPNAPLKEFECRSWFWASCPSVAIDIVNYIMTAVLGICVLLSLLSGMLVDTAQDDPERRTEWYLFQRAGKLWSMIYQMQLIAAAGLINFAYPTSFMGFLRYWNWILLSWGFPWHHSPNSQDGWADSSVQTGRTTQSWSQYTTYWKAEPDNIFFTWLLWFGVTFGIFLVLCVVMVIVAFIRGGRAAFLGRTRPVFIGLRMLELGHLGLCVIGPLSMVKGGTSAIIGGIIWAVFGLGAPLGLFVWLGFLKDKKGLFQPSFAASCYPFYGAFDFRYRIFIVAPWAKRILLGIFIGFVSTSNPLAQLIPIAIINLAYLVFVIIQRNMFSDYLQRYLEIILAALNFVAFLFLFGFYGTPSSGVVNTMGIIFLILQFIGVAISAAFFIISWLQLNQIYSVAQCFKSCTKST